MPDIEHIGFADLECRADESGTLSGIVIPYGGKSAVVRKNGTLVEERFLPGSVSWQEPGGCVLTRQHHPLSVVAVTPSSMTLEQRAEGVYFAAQPPDTALYKEIRAEIAAGQLGALSACLLYTSPSPRD